jgi:DNA-binding PadR family transcriptional regulator
MSRSVVPRGFSRFYVLSLLRERPMTGKQIMDETERRSRGAWRPSPGLVYPLLATDKGVRVLEDYERSQEEFEKRFGAWIRLGLFGRFLAQDLVDRLMGLISMVREDIARLGREQRERYRAFLLAELRRLDEEER